MTGTSDEVHSLQDRNLLWWFVAMPSDTPGRRWQTGLELPRHDSSQKRDMKKRDTVTEPQVAEKKKEEVSGQETIEVILLTRVRDFE